ncbi:MAG: glycoside hydrolase family 3 C-terminal domain-containing protein [Clostridia bacterium]|nr:glycoside hydrolase family 3 C-terminal domain-containing protein [Clostridia bacterium]
MNMTEARQKAAALVAQMTPEEKISQLLNESPAIERLGIHEYNWWNEASHGVARSGMATVFPHAIALASTFDPALIGEVGEAVSTEGRAKYNKSVEWGDRDIYKGLTYWTPNINIFRDPRWGRGQETFGEDPFLTAQMGMNYVRGIQGEGEFLKASACSKHFAVHSGPEPLRHTFDAVVSQHDLWETYLPAFEWTVKSGVSGVMGAYNRLFGKPCCAMPMIREVLREKWGFEGYFVSDCGAINDIYAYHHYTNTIVEAAADALKSGCQLNCGNSFRHLLEAYEQDLITDEDLTEAAAGLFTIRYLLGEFEEERPYADIPLSKLDCREHRELNLKTAREAMVLLKNDGYLPLDPATEKIIAVIGPNAMNQVALEGNYNGMASEYITPADGFRRVFKNANVRAAKGSNIWLEKWNDCGGFLNMRSEGVAYAKEADVTVLCLGLDCTIEGEENGTRNEFFDNGDKKTLALPTTQKLLAEEICDACENVIVLLMSGSAIDLGEKITKKAHAIIEAWYPGAVGGLAAAELVAGVYSPSGRLPVTFYHEEDELPPFVDYDMKGRTYRYLDKEPLYPFGYGLSYTKFTYSDACLCAEGEDAYTVRFTVKNDGAMDGVEKAQVYARYTDSRTPTPNFQLCALAAVELAAGEEKSVALDVPKYWVSAVLEDGSRVAPDGEIALYVGGSQPDALSEKLTGFAPLCVKIK